MIVAHQQAWLYPNSCTRVMFDDLQQTTVLCACIIFYLTACPRIFMPVTWLRWKYLHGTADHIDVSPQQGEAPEYFSSWSHPCDCWWNCVCVFCYIINHIKFTLVFCVSTQTSVWSQQCGQLQLLSAKHKWRNGWPTHPLKSDVVTSAVPLFTRLPS